MKKNGVDLHFKTGNHDHWFQDFLEKRIMTKVYTNDIDINIHGKRFFITHGDGILSWDYGYRVLKKIIRSRIFITIFRWIHPTIAYKIAKFISRSGKEDMHEADFNKDVKIELQSFAKKHGLQFEELPLEVPPVEQYLIWHSSDDNDGSHIWMRELITEAFDASKTS